MISGATRGTGVGTALSKHLMKDENEVTVLPGRGLGSTTLQGRIAELVALSETQLMNIRNFGQKSVDEVKDKLVSLGLSLKDSVPGFDGAHFYGGYDDETV